MRKMYHHIIVAKNITSRCSCKKKDEQEQENKGTRDKNRSSTDHVTPQPAPCMAR